MGSFVFQQKNLQKGIGYHGDMSVSLLYFYFKTAAVELRKPIKQYILNSQELKKKSNWTTSPSLVLREECRRSYGWNNKLMLSDMTVLIRIESESSGETKQAHY